jgi:mono/diheme cytochrome c family protein
MQVEFMEQEPYKHEMDWPELFKKPIKLFGYSYFYFLAVCIVLGLVYLRNINTIGKNAVTPVQFSDSTAWAQDIPLQSPRVIPPIDVMKAGVSSAAMVDKGRELYKNNCAACHGTDGMGDGVSAALLNPKPRNLHSRSGWKNGPGVTQIFKTLQEGISGSAMASYNYMPPEERFALIHYIRTFAGALPQDSREDLKRLDATYELSKGVNVTGQIPIRKAMTITEKEAIVIAGEVEQAKIIFHGSSGEGAEILRRSVLDERRMLTVMLRSKKSLSSVNELIKIVTSDPLHSGFRPSVTNLSASEWSKMHSFIISLMKKEGRS